MTLTWKDTVTTVLAVATGTLAYGMHQQWPHWLTNWRLGALVLAVLGVGMCTLGTDTFKPITTWTVALSALGVVAFGLILGGLITGSRIAFYGLAMTILALWLLTTLRHVLA